MQSVSSSYPNLPEAKVLLSSDTLVPLTALVVSCDILTKGGCFAWELETTLDELEDMQCLPKPEARDRLLGGLAALSNPAFLWDAPAFMALSQTINGELAIPHIWEPLSPAKLAYSLNELNALYKVYNNVDNVEVLFSEEPKIYIAGCLANSGMPRCPEELTLCSEQLERFFEHPQELHNDVNNPVLKRKLDEVKVYVSTMSKLRAKKMRGLATPR